MSDQEIRKTLEKQLQLLSERSQKTESVEMLCKLTDAMIGVFNALHWSSGQ